MLALAVGPLASLAHAQVTLSSSTEQHWYALIDTAGNRVGNLKFESFRSFRNGMAAAGVESLRKTWITLNGDSIPGNYRHVSDFDALGFAMANDYEGHGVVVDKTGRVVRKIKPKVWDVMHETLFGYTGEDFKHVGLVNSQGVEIVKPSYYKIAEFSEGLALVQFDSSSAHLGWVDTTGALVLKGGAYALAGYTDDVEVRMRGEFHNGRAVVKVTEGGRETAAFIDRTGRVVLQGPWRHALDFSEGFAAVQAMGDSTAPWGFIDTTGKYLVPPRLKKAWSFHHGAARFATAGLDSLITPSGKLLTADGNFTGDMGDNGWIGYTTKSGFAYERADNKEALRVSGWGLAGFAFSQGRAPVELKSSTDALVVDNSTAWVWFEIKQGGSLNSQSRQFYLTYAIVDGPVSPRRGEIEEAVTNKPRNSLAVTIASGTYLLPRGETRPDIGDIMQHSAAKPRYTKDASGAVSFIDSMDSRWLGRFKTQ